MFKAKLIENKNYYSLRTKQVIFFLLFSIPIGLIGSFDKLPIWLVLLILGLFIAAIILMVRNQKQINSVLGNKLIEIDIDEIRIKSKKGIEEETINLNNVEKIFLKDKYSMPQETIKEFGDELKGKAKQNYIILHIDSLKRKLEFEFDSYYMINQLNKLIETWKTKGYTIELINQQ